LQGGIPKALRTKWVFLCYNKGGKNFPGDRGKEHQKNFPEDHLAMGTQFERAHAKRALLSQQIFWEVERGRSSGKLTGGM
jgi:hypothetical protein